MFSIQASTTDYAELGASEMRDEGSQRCNLWITRYFKFARWSRAQSLCAPSTRKNDYRFAFPDVPRLATFSSQLCRENHYNL
jgi:hypothetical protein